jgi:hypothetical protein
MDIMDMSIIVVSDEAAMAVELAMDIVEVVLAAISIVMVDISVLTFQLRVFGEEIELSKRIRKL